MPTVRPSRPWFVTGLLAAAAVLLFVMAASAGAAPGVIRDGDVRFQFLTPTLLRIQIAADGRFEDRRTQLTADRLSVKAPKVRTRIAGKDLVLQTSRVTVRWRRGGTSPADGNLRARIGRRVVRPRTGPNPGSLGGWRRSLDLTSGPVPLHEGVLSRAGWSLVDDTATAVVSGDAFAPRPAHDGTYADLYVFLSGDDPARALRDLRVLSGPSPLLPRKAFGVWFSKWSPYSADELDALIKRFGDEHVPLDTLSVDTDFKRVNEPVGAAAVAGVVGAPGRPYSWNGWEWNEQLFPDPAAFLARAHRAGVSLAFNIHPSIDSRDPAFAQAQSLAKGKLKPSESCRTVQADTQGGTCNVFDWADPDQLKAYFSLHAPFEKDGVDFWWLDWCCDGATADMAGLTPDTFINRAYARRQRGRGSRWPAFSRIGGSYQAGFDGSVGVGALAEHASTIQFTGDTCGGWPQLAFAAQYTAGAAAIGQTYVSHDIGSFHAVSPANVCDATLSPILTPQSNSLPDDLYVRWVQLGAFQPLERLHSHHGKRLPWEYAEPARSIAATYLRLRESLNPYLYRIAREAHDTGIPMVRPLYLQWPKLDAAYGHPTQYLLGSDLLVAPVVTAGSAVDQDVWFPPGTWSDLLTGERHRGPGVQRLRVPLARMPVFVRAGATLPTQGAVPTTEVGPPTSLTLTAARGSGTSAVYDDAGDGLAYAKQRASLTRLVQRRRGRTTTLTIVPPKARFDGLPASRTWTLHLVGYARPTRVTIGTRRVLSSYNATAHTITVTLGRRSTRRPVRVTLVARGA